MCPAEAMIKEEALRIKEEYECDIHELEIALNHANKVCFEANKAMKKSHMHLSDVTSAIEEVRKEK